MKVRRRGSSRGPTIAVVIAIPLILAGIATYVWQTIPPEPDPTSLPSQSFAAPAAGFEDAAAEGRAVARELIAEEKLPGLSLAVAVDGEVVWAEGFRWAEMESETPDTPATLFRIGGISQSLTAVSSQAEMVS